VSWALLGFIVVTMIYFAIWEAHRIDIPKTRWFLLIAPWIILAVGPVVWPLVEVYFTRPAILAQAQGAPAPGEVSTIQGIEFVWIPPGRFRMGSPSREPARDSDERSHVVTLRYGFWMSRYEITRGQWEAVMGPDPSRPPQEPDEPVNGVSWQDCQDFLTKLNATQPRAFRLPTEAEWEYACRATTMGPYSFDVDASQLGEYAWFAENSGKKVHRVGQKAPSPWGLYDAHGNVWEWCRDWYGPYPDGHVVDPTGPAYGTYHVIRGGAWNSPPEVCRSAARSFFMEGYFLDKSVLGFRIVRAPALPAPAASPLVQPGARPDRNLTLPLPNASPTPQPAAPQTVPTR
jgi:formylglycine-generating enzyme required for sulfatase activity